MTDPTEGEMEPGGDSRLRHAEALRLEAEALLERGHVDEALSAFASVVAEFADSQDQDVRAEAQLAGYSQAYTLTEMGRHADVLAAIAKKEGIDRGVRGCRGGDGQSEGSRGARPSG